MPVDLLQYSKGGGCGCKLEPGKLSELLKTIRQPDNDKLLVGFSSSDDAAVYDLSDGTAIVHTVDFFLPVVSNPYDFGKISAANALSDVYAMGGKPLMALSILAWPEDQVPLEEAAEVMRGALEVCQSLNVPIAGGHSIHASEPMFGLSVTGLTETKFIKRNNTSRPGDFLHLSKPLGLGLLANAHKHQQVSAEQYELLLKTASKVNSDGYDLARNPAVSALTDVTGFGLLGHLKEMLAGAQGAELYLKDVPLLSGIEEIAARMLYPNITTNNYNYVKDVCDGLDGLEFLWLCDPQTGGGLLFSASEPIEGYPLIGRVTDTGRIKILR